MNIITDRRVTWEFFKDRLNIHWSTDWRGIIWVDSLDFPSMDDVAVAVGFNGFVGKTCLMHVVIQKPEKLTRHIIREVFRYVFKECGVVCVFGMVDSTNTEALDFDRRIGFRDFAVVPAAGTTGDLVILSMAKENCRWLKEK